MAKGKQLYDKYADIPALEKQTQQILGMLKEVGAGVKALSALGVKLDNSKSVTESDKLKKATSETTVALNKQQQQLVRMAVDLKNLTTEEAKKIEGMKQVMNLTKQVTAEEIKNQKLRQLEYQNLLAAKLANQELNKVLTLRIKIRQAESGSEEKLTLQYQRATGILKKLSEAQRQTTRGQELERYANSLNEKLKQIEQRTGNFRRNVGNYAGSLSGLFDKVAKEIEKLSAKQKELQERKTVTGFLTPQQQQELDKTTNAMTELTNVMAIGQQEGLGFQQVVRKIGFEFSNLSTAGNQSKEFLNEFKQDAAEAKDAAQDLKDEIKAMSSDTRSVDLMVGAINGIVGVAQTAAGAMGLFGKNTKDTEKITQKLVALQSVANGVQQISQQLTNKTTIAYKAMNFVLVQSRILFGSGATAATRFGAALKLTGIGLLVTGITLLISKMNLFGDSAEEEREKVDKLNESIEALYQSKKKLVDLIGQNPQESLEIKLLEQQLSLAQANGESLQKQFALKQQIAIKEKALAEEQIQTIIKRGDAVGEEGFFEMDQYDQILAAQQSFYDQTVDLNNELISLRRQRIKGEQTLSEEEKTLYDNRIKDLEANISLTQQSYDEYTALINRAADAQSKIETQAAENRNRIREAEKKAALDYLKLQKQIIIEQNEAFASDDTALGPQSQIEAVKKIAQARRDVLDAVYKYEISQKDLAVSKIKELDLQYNNDKFNLAFETEQKITNIVLTEARKRADYAKQSSADFDTDMEERLQKEIDILTKANEKRVNEIDKNRAQSEQLNQQLYEDGTRSLEAYEAEKARIEADYQKHILEQQIIFYQAQVDLLKASGQDTSQLEAAIEQARAALGDARIEKLKENAAQEKQILEEVAQNYYNAFLKLNEAVSNILGGIAERRKAQIQEEMDLIDKRKEKEIEAATKSGDTEEKKAARVKLIEAKAQSEKDALARRQRQIDRQKAVADRAFKIFQTTTDTIQAVAKIKAQIAILQSNPLTLPYVPVASSALVLAIASGAAALTSLIAAPLPAYKKGTDYSVGGPARVAEEGPELAIEPSGKKKLFTRDSIVDLIEGTRILPANVTRDVINKSRAQDVEHSAIAFVEPSVTDNSDIVYELKEIKKRTGIVIQNQRGIESTAWFMHQFKN